MLSAVWTSGCEARRLQVRDAGGVDLLGISEARRLRGQAVDAGGLDFLGCDVRRIQVRDAGGVAFRSAMPTMWTSSAAVEPAAFGVRPSMQAA